MDLKKFKDVDGDEVASSASPDLHQEDDQIIKELEARIAAINNESKESVHTDLPVASQVSEQIPIESIENNLYPETTYIDTNIDTKQSETFLDKIKPFILPIFLTIFSLIFASIFMFFFSQSRIERSVQAITNQQTQAEVIVIRDVQPEVKQDPVVIPEVVVPECDPETQILNEEENICEDKPEPEKPEFDNGTTTILKVKFSYDSLNYDNYPRGIYLSKEQIFQGEYEDYKLLTINRPDANDMFFGLGRNMVSLIGACKYVVDEAEILVENVRSSEGDQVYSAIKDQYFRGKMLKVLEHSKPHIVCGR